MYYQLTETLSCCLVEEYWVFLDCVADRYFAIQAKGLQSGAPDLANPAFRSCALSNFRADALTPVIVSGPRVKLDTGKGPRDLRSCLAAYICLVRAFLMRSGHFAKFEAISGKARHRIQALEPKASLEQSVRSFEAVMRWLPVENQCLPQALALQEFLVSAGHDAMVVVGVAINPFKAHCWVQNGDHVLLQAPEFVRGYYPIRVFR